MQTPHSPQVHMKRSELSTEVLVPDRKRETPLATRRANAATRSRCGAVMMETVLLSVLIAAAAVVAIIVLGRAITGDWLVLSKAAVADSKGASADMEMRRGDRENDLKVADQYHENMTGGGGAP